MRFLVDESSGRRTSELLKEAGHDASFVGDMMSAASDEMVLAVANEQNRILVTDDKDFGELIFRLQEPASGVVLFRTSTTDPQRRVGKLLGVIENHKLEGYFITIAEDKIKIRKIR